MGITKGQSFGWEETIGKRWTENKFPESYVTGDFTPSNNVEDAPTHGGDLMQFIYLANYSAITCGSNNKDPFSCVMRDIAASLTSTLRDSNALTNGSSSTDLVTGRLSMSITTIRAQWVWLALPIGIWLLGFIAWAGTAVQTELLSIPIRRDNPLPFLFLYREGKVTEKVEELKGDATWAYQDVAARMQARLEPGSDGLLKFVREQSSESP